MATNKKTERNDSLIGPPRDRRGCPKGGCGEKHIVAPYYISEDGRGDYQSPATGICGASTIGNNYITRNGTDKSVPYVNQHIIYRHTRPSGTLSDLGEGQAYKNRYYNPERSDPRLCITHYTLHITHYTLHITHYALCITHYKLRIINSSSHPPREKNLSFITE